jgi:hypothetical protein
MNGYNGWTNRDTWLVALWIDNDRKNYQTMTQNKEHFLNYTDEAFRKSLQHLNYGDEIDFSKVDINEIREIVREMEA